MSVQIPNHDHCIICRRAVEFGEKTCGPEHKAELEEMERKVKRRRMVTYVIMAGLVVLLILQLLYPPGAR